MVLKKTVRAFFSIYALLRPKIWLPNVDSHQFSYNERLTHSKKHKKKNLHIVFEEKRAVFSILALSRSTIGLANLDTHQFS